MAGSGGAGRVSIPFIAGQWSLLIAFIAALALVASFQSPSLRGSGRFKPKPLNEVSVEPSFNPLHCGAVVASYAPLVYQQDSTLVSIPFIAGQWSLRVTPMKKKEKTEKFQSPSLRGSGRFQPGRRRKAPEGAGFNPLHCGAVVASEARASAVERADEFQSPSLRGSGRFRTASAAANASRAAVSIPFIAGQWSLRTFVEVSDAAEAGFNPLHCGAVVASYS